MRTLSQTPKAIREREYRKKNPHKTREWSRNYQEKIRLLAIESLGGKCCQCGYSDFRALQIDHINGGGNKVRGKTNRGWAKTYNSIISGEDSDYQLLCANCNWIKRHTNKEV